MADEKILLDIKFNNSEIQAAIKNIAVGRKTIDELVAANKKLAEQGQKNSEEYVKNTESIKALNAEVSQNSKLVQASTQANKLNADSLGQLKARNTEILILRDKLTTETKEGRDEIAKLNAEYDKNSKVIANNSTEVEKQRFNIGNYISGLTGVSPILGQIQSNTAGMVGGLKSATQGIGGMTTAAQAFGKVGILLIITGLVAAFKALETFLTGSTKGVDLLEDVMSSLSVVLDVVVDRVNKFVGAVGKLLSGDFKGGLTGIQESFSGIGDEIEREIALTLELNAAIRDLEDAEINYDIQASKTANTIKQLLLQSKNRTLSEKERIALLDRASKLEAEQNTQLVKNREEALRIANEEANKRVEIARIAGETEAEFAQRLLDTGLLLDDQRDKVKDSIIAFNGALGSSIDIQEKIQNQQDALAEKAEADREKRAEAEKKRLEDIAKKAEELRQREVTAANELAILQLEKEAREIQGLENQTDKLIEIEQERAEQLLENTELTESERQRIIFESDEAINEILRQSRENEQLEQQAALEQSLEDFRLYTEGLVNEKKNEYLNGIISKQEYDQEIADLEFAALETQLAIKEAAGEKDIALEGKLTDYKIALGQKEVDAKKIQEQAKIQAVQQAIGTIANAFNKQSVAYKVLASIQTTIDTIRGAFNVFTGMTSAIPGPVGIILGAAAAAATTATGIAAVAKINSQPVVKMEEGGLVDLKGPRHSRGGMDVVVGGQTIANVEGGEKMAILKRGASDRLLRNLSLANTLVGGKDFYRDRAPRFHNADGGFIARSAANQVGTNPRNINQQLQNQKIVLQVSELHRVEDNMQRAQVTSELS